MNPNRTTRRLSVLCLWVALAPAIVACSQQSIPEAPYDVLIRHGHILDGTGNPWYAGDIAIRGDRIAAIGTLEGAKAKRVIDASGLVVSPGFIDMLGQSEESLLIDKSTCSHRGTSGFHIRLGRILSGGLTKLDSVSERMLSC